MRSWALGRGRITASRRTHERCRLNGLGFALELASGAPSTDIHDRMPVRLAPGLAEEWISADADGAMAMLLASEPPAMEAYRFSGDVNAPRNNAPTLLDPVA